MTPAEKAVIEAAVKWQEQFYGEPMVMKCGVRVSLACAVTRLLRERETKARKGARP